MKYYIISRQLLQNIIQHITPCECVTAYVLVYVCLSLSGIEIYLQLKWLWQSEQARERSRRDIKWEWGRRLSVWIWSLDAYWVQRASSVTALGKNSRRKWDVQHVRRKKREEGEKTDGIYEHLWPQRRAERSAHKNLAGVTAEVVSSHITLPSFQFLPPFFHYNLHKNHILHSPLCS